MNPAASQVEIVLVDDDRDGQFVTAHYLRKFLPKAQISVFSSAEEALTAMDSRWPDAIVTDYRLPAMSGIEFIRRIRTHDINVPIMIMSGMDSAEGEALAARGPMHFCRQPERESLVESWRNCCVRAQVRRGWTDLYSPFESWYSFCAMLPTSTCTLGIAIEKRREAIERMRQALTDQEWTLVKITSDATTLAVSAPPRVLEKIQQAVRLEVS